MVHWFDSLPTHLRGAQVDEHATHVPNALSAKAPSPLTSTLASLHILHCQGCGPAHLPGRQLLAQEMHDPCGCVGVGFTRARPV